MTSSFTLFSFLTLRTAISLKLLAGVNFQFHLETNLFSLSPQYCFKSKQNLRQTWHWQQQQKQQLALTNLAFPEKEMTIWTGWPKSALQFIREKLHSSEFWLCHFPESTFFSSVLQENFPPCFYQSAIGLWVMFAQISHSYFREFYFFVIFLNLREN